MFFRHKWLTSNGRLHDPWVAATLSGTTIIKLSNSMDSDIRYICDDLSELLNSNSKYIKHRISLRLAAILIYGTCVIYRKKTLELLNDCTYEFVKSNPTVIDEKINVALLHVSDSEINSLKQSLHFASQSMFPEEQDSDSSYTLARYVRPSSSFGFDTLFQTNEVEAVRQTLNVSNSPQTHGSMSDFGDSKASYLSINNHLRLRSPTLRHMKIDHKNGNSSCDLRKIYNCEFSLPYFIIGFSGEEDASYMSPVAPTIIQPTTNNPATNVLKIHDLYNNFMLHLTFEDCPEQNHKKKARKFPNRVDKYKEFRSSYWRSQNYNVKCHLRCQTAQEDVIDIRKMSSTHLFSTMHNHTHRNRRLSQLYCRNLLTRKISLDKDIFETVSEPGPEICRQQKNISNTSDVHEADFVHDNNGNSIYTKQILAVYSDSAEDDAKRVKNSNNKISKESQKNNPIPSEVDVISDKEKLSSANITLSESKTISHIGIRDNSKQSVYVLFPSKGDAIRAEDLKIFLGSDFNLKSKQILKKKFPQIHQSKFHSTNAKDYIKRQSTFHTFTESDEWNELDVIEKLNNLWIRGMKVSFKMLLQQGRLGSNSSSTIAKVFSTLINLRKSHFVNIFKNNEGEIEFITKGPALWMGTSYRSYSI